MSLHLGDKEIPFSPDTGRAPVTRESYVLFQEKVEVREFFQHLLFLKLPQPKIFGMPRYEDVLNSSKTNHYFKLYPGKPNHELDFFLTPERLENSI